MENKETTISAVPPSEAGHNERRCVIRFDCLVKMYDIGYITPKEDWFGLRPLKPYAPQWFKSQSYITLEGVKYADPYTLGLQIKRQFEQLEQAIKKYEQGY